MTMGIETKGGPRPWRVLGWGGALCLLAVPLVAGAPWTPADYVFAPVLMGAVGLGMELAARRGATGYRLAAALALAAGFLLLWMNAAVGIIGNEEEDANLLFAGVVAVALIGAAAARGRPAGMARAMLAAAAAQLAVPVVVWMLFDPAVAALLRRPEVPVLTAGFTALWLAAAGLFWRAAARG
jgi:hypothetical protein